MRKWFTDLLRGPELQVNTLRGVAEDSLLFDKYGRNWTNVMLAQMLETYNISPRNAVRITNIALGG